MKCKRGTLPAETMVVMVILLLVLVIVSSIFFQKFGFFGLKYDQLELQANARSCQSQGLLAVTVYDNDYGNNQGDKFPDGCDFCLGGDDGAPDQDGNGIPPACDDDSDNPPARGTTMKEICENARPADKSCIPGVWVEKTQQCRLKCYGQPRQGI